MASNNENGIGHLRALVPLVNDDDEQEDLPVLCLGLDAYVS